MREVIIETLIDGLKLLPFLFITYLIIEFIEHKAEEKTVAVMNRAGRLGPVVGGVLGAVPQCGFSTAVSNLYAGGVISKGTVLAVFLSTSDEMLPVLISENAPAALIFKILAVKVVIGIAVGLAADAFLYRRGRTPHLHIHEMCESEGCRCEDGVFKSALRHTVKIFLFILAITFVLNTAVHLIGEERLAGFILNVPVLGEMIAGLIGLIPNCAASVVITELYLQGGMSAGAMLSGLLVSSGVGLLVLLRMNKNARDNIETLIILYVSGVLFGTLVGRLPIF